jgi:CRISPR system Cascade subunit CasA
VWRHSEELLLAGDSDRQRPRALDHIDARVRTGAIRANAIYTLRVFGQQLDSKGGAVESWLEEEVPAPVALLRAESRAVGVLVGYAVKLAEDAGAGLREMERGYHAELAANSSSTVDLMYWPRLPEPFGVLLRELATALQEGQPETAAITAWARAVQHAARESADQWVYGSPRRGRELLAAGKHHGAFLGKVAFLGRRYLAEAAAVTTEEEAV